MMNGNHLILIVDDEPEILKLYSLKLQKSGFEVTTAENGQRGIESALGQRKPDLILMDVKMPVMDGIEAFTKLRENPETKDIKIVFLTAFNDLRIPEIDVKVAREIGAAGFIKKGIDLDEFVTKIRQVLAS
jgi:two-component system alkaline phosphatase synthesis response regulator PhoP